MFFQSQFPHKSVNLVRIPNKNTFSSAEIIERRINLCPEASSRGLRGGRFGGPLEARNGSILKVGLLELHQSRAGLVT
jgi:hypothetical protein